MGTVLRKSLAIGLGVVGSFVVAHPVLANPFLPGLTNLDFVSYTGTAPKDYFTNVDPVGWTGGTGLIFIDAPGTSTTSPATACGTTYLSTWGCPSTLKLPGGYNEVQADGNPIYESGFNYSVKGLTPGTTYSLSFYQAASQQGPNSGAFTGATTEQWIVSLGTSGLTVCAGCLGNGNSSYSSADSSASIALTPVMSTPSGGLVDWNYVTLNLTADSTTDLLSFLAWGDNGNTANLPPMVFLTGVDSPSGLTSTPEPGSLALFGGAVVAVGFAVRRYRKNKVSDKI